MLLINPNGVAITKNGVVKTDPLQLQLYIKNSDFLRISILLKKKNSKGVENSGKIIVGNGEMPHF